MRISFKGCFIAAVLLLFAALSHAENSSKIPGNTIHHNAFTTSELSPEMANAYGIRRSANRALLNVSIIRDKEGTIGTPVTAQVSVMARNLRGQIRTIPMREVKEPGAVYYLGEFLVENQETVDFTIEVKPTGAKATSTVMMQQQFFTR